VLQVATKTKHFLWCTLPDTLRVSQELFETREITKFYAMGITRIRSASTIPCADPYSSNAQALSRHIILADWLQEADKILCKLGCTYWYKAELA
jgi:hypothetical protein